MTRIGASGTSVRICLIQSSAKGVPGEIGLPLRLRQTAPAGTPPHGADQRHTSGFFHYRSGNRPSPDRSPAGRSHRPACAPETPGCTDPYWRTGRRRPAEYTGSVRPAPAGWKAVSFQFQRLWIVQDLRAVLAGIDPAQHGDKKRVLYNTQLGHGQPSYLDELLSAHKQPGRAQHHHGSPAVGAESFFCGINEPDVADSPSPAVFGQRHPYRRTAWASCHHSERRRRLFSAPAGSPATVCAYRLP